MVFLIVVRLRCSGNGGGAVKIFELQQLDYHQGVYCLEENLSHLNLGTKSQVFSRCLLSSIYWIRESNLDLN